MIQIFIFEIICEICGRFSLINSRSYVLQGLKRANFEEQRRVVIPICRENQMRIVEIKNPCKLARVIENRD